MKGAHRQLDQLRDRLPGLESSVVSIQLRFDDWATSARSTVEAQSVELQRRIGYLDREIQEIDARLNLARSIEELSEDKARKAEQVSLLEDELSRLKERELRRRQSAYDLVCGFTAATLQRDLDTEDEFRHAAPETVHFDFGADRVEVEQRSNYSASSMAVARNAFRIGLLQASMRDPSIRYPRFLLIDSIEDKGMQEARSQNLQRVIVEMSGEEEATHQIILTTSMIAEEFEGSDLTVGAHYTKQHKSLAIGR